MSSRGTLAGRVPRDPQSQRRRADGFLVALQDQAPAKKHPRRVPADPWPSLRGLDRLRPRPASATLLSRITIDPEVCHGKPVIRGLRYPVESILEYLAAGDSLEDVLAEFPDLEREDLLACLEFAQRSLQLKSQHLALA